MPVPFLELARQHEELATEIAATLAAVGRRGSYILGPEVSAFEAEWAGYCGVSGAVGVGNGTDALTLALLASGVIHPHQGDEVITTPLTPIHWWHTQRRCGSRIAYMTVTAPSIREPSRRQSPCTARHRSRSFVGAMAHEPSDIRGHHSFFSKMRHAHGATATGHRGNGGHGTTRRKLGQCWGFQFHPTKI